MVILSRVFTWLQENGSSHVSFSDKTNHLPLFLQKKHKEIDSLCSPILMKLHLGFQKAHHSLPF